MHLSEALHRLNTDDFNANDALRLLFSTEDNSIQTRGNIMYNKNLADILEEISKYKTEGTLNKLRLERKFKHFLHS